MFKLRHEVATPRSIETTDKLACHGQESFHHIAYFSFVNYSTN